MSPVEVVQEPFCSHNRACTAVPCRVAHAHAANNWDAAPEGNNYGVRREQLGLPSLSVA